LENLLHAENVAQKKINSDEHFDHSFAFCRNGKQISKPKRKEKQ